MLAAFHRVEAATLVLESDLLSFSFAVPGMMMKYWEPVPLAPEYVTVREGYQQALDFARQAGVCRGLS